MREDGSECRLVESRSGIDSCVAVMVEMKVVRAAESDSALRVSEPMRGCKGSVSAKTSFYASE